MRRRVLTIALFLLAGAVVNVSMAWGLEFGFGLPVPDPLYIKGERVSVGRYECASWTRVAGVDWPRRPSDAWVEDLPGGGRLTKISHRTQPPDQMTRPILYFVHIVERGSPLPCLSMERWTEFHYSNLVRWECNGYVVAERFVPTHPLWPGFVANTAFYATVLWLLIPGPFVLRRFVRARRGLCPRCAYPKGDSPVCSECGRELPKRVRARPEID